MQKFITFASEELEI